jgi:AcrR family transcriptional regulator
MDLRNLKAVEATAEELSRVGYAAMRVEDVAARSGVHKTTIYRRWPPSRSWSRRR